MQNKFVVYIITVLFPVCLFAQAGNDTLLLEYQKALLKENFLKHNLSAVPNFGEVSLNYSSNTGDRRLSQQAHNRNSLEFYALGANQLGDFRISGDFLFDKIFEDSLAFGQRNDIDRWSPFNYYASKAGKYEIQNYKTNLTLSYNFKNGFQPFFNVNYLHHWTTGSVDPRVESKKFEMKYNPGLIYNFKKSSIGAKAILGNGRENLGLDYKSDNYASSLLYPDRIHYLNMGYGFNNIKDTLNTRKYSLILGTELSFNTQIGNNILDISSSFERKRENNSNDIRSSKKYNIRSKYIEETFNLNASLQLPQAHSQQLFMLDANYVNGYDGHVEFAPDLSRVNYTVKYLETTANYLFTRLSPQVWNYDLGLDVNYFSVDRNDYASTLAVANSYVRISPIFRVRYDQENLDNLQFAFTPGYQKSLSNSIQYSTNALNNYIQGVVFWDYDYYLTNAYQLNWTARWTTKRISSQYWTGINLSYNYHRNLERSGDALSSFKPNATLQHFTIGLFLNL